MAEKCCVEEDYHQWSDHDHHGHSHELTLEQGVWRIFAPAIISLILLLSALVLDNWWEQSWFDGWLKLAWYILAYIPVGAPVIKDAFLSVRAGDVYSEFFLMTIATLGAFAIGVYPEAVAVMLFYTIGEIFQSLAVTRAKSNIKTLLDIRPDEIRIIEGDSLKTILAKDAEIGDVIELRAGEELALDGVLLSTSASFNTSALTGESKPNSKYQGEEVLAGMINQQNVVQVKVTAVYADSKLSKILELVQEATTRKAPTELFIRKFAKVYTPIVVYLALAICLLPYIFLDEYIFKDWLYRALVFLVISCPCALVISIPLGFFGGIGAGSKHGILFKGGNYLDALSNIQNVVVDKTGTMTEGVFEVKEVVIDPKFNQGDILQLVNALESHSTHPIATAIHHYVGEIDTAIKLYEIQELPGYGLKALVDDKELLVGNFKLMDKLGIDYNIKPNEVVETTLAIGFEGEFVGYITIADRIKEDAARAVQALHQMDVKVTMLSGDKSSVVDSVAKTLQIDTAYGDLLPEDKVTLVEEIKSRNESVAFVGDGVNDAPVLVLSDVGIAMGGLGSDAAIEAADVVIQDDQPSKIPLAIKIGRETRKIVWQNISLAFGVKAIVLILGAGGLASMWEAVFADVGVALLAIFNAIRIQRMKFL